MVALPNIVCLKSNYNGKYLRYRYEASVTHGLVQFSADFCMNPYAQFEVEKDKSSGDLVHLKSRYSNKYLGGSPTDNLIGASAYAANEDQTNWACTLFKPIVTEETKGIKKYRLLHVQLGYYVKLALFDVPLDSCLLAASRHPDTESKDIIIIIDWESIFRLPTNVAFRGDNGQYLGFHNFDNIGLQFSFPDPKDPRVAQKIYPMTDGNIAIQSQYLGTFWGIGDKNWITLDAEDPRYTHNTVAMFKISVVTANVVALLNMKKNLFVQRLSGDGRDNSLAAAAQNVDPSIFLEVVDVDSDV